METSVIAYNGRGHLDTAMGGHAVELGFIAGSIGTNAVVQPQAGFYGSMGACKMVSVFFEEGFRGFGY